GRMLVSARDAVREAAGRLAAFAALFNERRAATKDDEPRPVDLALSGDPHLRFGVAQVAAANVGHSDFQELCQTWLAALFFDDEERVRNAASEWCRSV